MFNHGDVWLQWLAGLIGKPDVRALEIGSNQGDSAAWLLDNVLTGEGAALTCVDCWDDAVNHGVRADAAAAELAFERRTAPYGRRVMKLKGWSLAWLPRLPRDAYDLVYIDASHDAASVLEDSVLAWPRIKSGGILIWDDYLWPLGQTDVDRPKLGIDAFTGVYARQLELLAYPAWQVAVRKH